MVSKVASADEVAARISDGATLAITGAGGGLNEPDDLLAAIERRFLATGAPRDLTVMHAQGIGDGDRRGMNRLAHEGLVKRVIGAHWSWSPAMQRMAAEGRIEAYAIPAGAIQHLARETGAGRPGLITPIGLETMADPRLGGGRMNARTTEALSEIIIIDGREYIRYKPIRIDFAILRGSVADSAGNVSFEDEGAELDALVLAIAAHNGGGQVLVQVRDEVERASLPARRVRLPGALVDAVVTAPAQAQSHGGPDDPRLSGSEPSLGAAGGERPTRASGLERAIIGARAAQELRDGSIVAFGFGMPDEVAAIAAEAPELTIHTTVDHGHHGGESLTGALFGFVRNGAAMIDSPSQFDLYSGGGIDTAFLGFGEFDAHGDVNVSRLNGRIVGPGGFIDISQGSRKLVFCGTFEAQGLDVALADQHLRIDQAGRVRKLVAAVDQVTFSGRRALRVGQEVLYVTERAVFRLTEAGVQLEELAPGIDLQRDVLARMGFTPLIRPGGLRAMRVAPYF